MPLHLLGKKSWNVYNTDNIERVRRDEAAARAQEEAAEQRMQDVDAERRTALLRGEVPPPLPEPVVEDERSVRRERQRENDGVPRERKRRRLRGEDETDQEMRYAREDAEAGVKASATLRAEEKEAPLHDEAGHIQLIPAPDEQAIRKAEKQAKLEAAKADKKRKDEDQFTMRFSNAAGFQQGLNKPWYADAKPGTTNTQVPAEQDMMLAEVQDKNVWGNEDPRRKQREQGRIVSTDPFAMMQRAQQQLKQSAKDREIWDRQRKKELDELAKENVRSEQRHKRRRHRNEEDELNSFSLDAPADEIVSRSHHERSEHEGRQHRHRRRRSRSRSRDRHYKRDRSRERRR